MKVGPHDFSVMGFASFDSIPKTNRPLFSHNYGIANTDDNPHVVISTLEGDWKRLGAVIVARFDPDNPDPTMRDIWTLGELQSDGYYHEAKGKGGYVAVVDFIVVAPNGTWKSVIRDTALRDEVICKACSALDTGMVDWKEARDWDEVEADHVPGCSWVAMKTAEAKKAKPARKQGPSLTRKATMDALHQFVGVLDFAPTVADPDPEDPGAGAHFARGIQKFLDPSNLDEDVDMETLLDMFVDDLKWAIQHATHKDCRDYEPKDSHADDYLRGFRAMFADGVQ